MRSADNGLWGYLDNNGAVAIPPAFQVAGFFSRGVAKVAIAPNKFGLIDPLGNWVIPPQWADIWPEAARCYVVEDDAGLVGAINPEGKIIVSLRPRAEVYDATNTAVTCLGLYDRDIVDCVMSLWRQELKLHVDTAKKSGSLSTLEGAFDPDASYADLSETGVWGMKVRVTRDKTEGILQPKAGECGHIFTQYPVSLSTFDLSLEAPVAGLATQPNAIIGVLWKDLAAIDAVQQTQIVESNENILAATRDHISEWFDRGVAQKATHLIVVCDTFDHHDYPCFANGDAEALERHGHFDNKNMQQVMEVYDLRADKGKQMAEHRAMHLPKADNN